MTPLSDFIYSGGLRNYICLAKDLHVGSIQLLEPKPCGRFESLVPDQFLSDNEKHILTEFMREVNSGRVYKDYPQVSYIAYYERPDLMGCQMGGLSTLYIDSAGNVNPCQFVPISFGKIMREGFIPIYHRMRAAVPSPLRKQCPSVALKEIIANYRQDSSGSTVPYSAVKSVWEKMYSPNESQIVPQ